jgi:orotate phosphoribosyltransferase
MEKNMAEIEKMLKESGALLEGHFLLSSGRHSSRYFQCAKFLQYPDRAAAGLKPLTDRLRGDLQKGTLAVDAIAGPALGGIIVAYELGRQLGLPAVFTERDESGGMTLRRGFEVWAGENILIAEDVITTAKSSAETARALEALGGRIAALACIVDRRSPGVTVPWRIYSAYTAPAPDWDPADCELCRQGRPLVKPGSRKIF